MNSEIKKYELADLLTEKQYIRYLVNDKDTAGYFKRIKLNEGFLVFNVNPIKSLGFQIELFYQFSEISECVMRVEFNVSELPSFLWLTEIFNELKVQLIEEGELLARTFLKDL